MVMNCNCVLNCGFHQFLIAVGGHCNGAVGFTGKFTAINVFAGHDVGLLKNSNA
jgi:hypothetical protein